jgi:hypothetical protein
MPPRRKWIDEDLGLTSEEESKQSTNVMGSPDERAELKSEMKDSVPESAEQEDRAELKEEKKEEEKEEREKPGHARFERD